ncbi:hypothetical protein BSK66_22230 [Paenibacillus odorifer]|uniref:Antitoxin SocA-like Panacea domain-containing protein n=1 Tax=Paenibacillus odorifer TaxID=189426 RepID=A0A1R0X091_9BACL|nr:MULTISPECIES: type II toxin-antitoxin system antitoxin SocA domain-containing protein [Paenibacillus]ETT55820.1 putative phage-associated protein [Paenibacillus sp. FSL H8-237]OMD25496.1 hypothetical protein BJP51_04410 [Paenibacillus odorifer]OME51955.1 hypothetical protein BSK66_22230 [Paenibacillus odorifer]
MPYPLFDVVDWFLAKGSMTPKKLQKVLYYAYAWYLTFENEDAERIDRKLFDADFEAWVHGPVIPEIYDEFKHLGYSEIPKFRGTVAEFDPDTLDTLEQVWETYGKYNGNELESITHQESPWIKARDGYGPLDRCNEEITDRDMYICYASRLET